MAEIKINDNEDFREWASEITRGDFEGWEWQGNHLTIRMGPLNPEKEADASLIPYVGDEVMMTIDEIGIDTELGVVAVGVKEAKNRKGELPCLTTDGRKPHITMWVNRNVGGKPFLSNKVTEWLRLTRVLMWTGVVEADVKG